MKIDMSPQAITNRLKQTSELRKLCIALGGNRLKRRLQKENAINRIGRTEVERT
jgi:hypothetical protein